MLPETNGLELLQGKLYKAWDKVIRANFCSFFSFTYFTLQEQDKISNFTLYHTGLLHLLLPLHF